jgi:hypothetical protein
VVLKRFSKRTWFVLWIFIVALIGAIATYAYMQRRSITREEAIEISTNSELIQSIWHLVEDADWYRLEAEYLNRTRINELKEGNPQFYDFFPLHCVWRVEWEVRSSKWGAGTIVVIHYIDEKTGEILHEGGVSLR